MKAEEHKKISVIIPCYNQASVLARSLQALAEQVEKDCDFEIIIVDDGSSDNTRDIVRSFIQHNNIKVTYITQQNQGVAAARNNGASHAGSSILLFLDADIISEPDMVSEHLQFHTEYFGETEVALGAVEMAAGLTHRRQIRQHETRLSFNPAKISDIPWYYLRGSSISLKRSFFEKAGGFSVEMRSASEDTELGYRLSQLGMKLKYLPFAHGYHYHPMNARSFMRKAKRYGISLAVWYQNTPQVQGFIVEHYGLWTAETKKSLRCKYALRGLLINHISYPIFNILAACTRFVSLPFSDYLYNEIYKMHYRRSFRSCLKSRKMGTQVNSDTRWSDSPKQCVSAA